MSCPGWSCKAHHQAISCIDSGFRSQTLAKRLEISKIASADRQTYSIRVPTGAYTAKVRLIQSSEMTVKAVHPSDNMQSPLSVLDVLSLESPESTAGKQRSSFLKLPPLSGQSVNSIFRRSSADGSRSVEGVGLFLPAPRPVLTVCATSPTRPNARGRLRVRSSLLSRSSSLNDNKVGIVSPLRWLCSCSPGQQNSALLCRCWQLRSCSEPPHWHVQTCSHLKTTFCLKA